MESAFHQLCPRYNGTLTPTANTAIRVCETLPISVIPPIFISNKRASNSTRGMGVMIPVEDIAPQIKRF